MQVSPAEEALERSDRSGESSLPVAAGHDGASHQISVTERGSYIRSHAHCEPREEPVTRPSLREYAAGQRERYLAATRAEKGAQLDEGVAGTGRHRKAAIRLLRRAPRAPTARSRAGRRAATAPPWPRRWRSCGALRLAPEVDAALDRLWTLAAADPHRQGAYRDRAPSSKSAPEGSETTPPGNPEL